MLLVFLKVLFNTKTKDDEEEYFYLNMIVLIICAILLLIIMILFFRINYGLISENPVNNYILNNNIFLNTEKQLWIFLLQLKLMYTFPTDFLIS